ncbi:NADH:ubiquinone oxidoreductase [bacterium]|nr:MAG: NADH:ubiquinone oxidoreductase [bacterium]
MKETIIPIGPFHPLLEEPELFVLRVDGETVVDVDLRIGWNHRGIEKLSQGLTWDQVPYLIERICGICSTSHPYACVLAMEDILDMEAPPRAQYIRPVVGELERIHSHLLWFGLAGHFIGYNTVFMWAWKYRELVLDSLERLTGNRNHYAMFKAGGVRRDFSDEAMDFTMKAMDEVEKAVKMFLGVALDDPVLHKRLKGVGVLTYEDAIQYSAVGPTSRPSGVDHDVRRDDPFDAYGPAFEAGVWKPIVLQDGDVFAKAACRILEMLESIKIIRWCIENMPDGEIDAGVTEIPPGEGCGHYEAPRGEVFHYMRSDGTGYPVRHKVRAPTYNNLPTYKATCPGAHIADVTLITASIDPCYCCTERVGIVDKYNNYRSVKQEYLTKLSVEKTLALKRDLGLVTWDPYAKLLK